MSTAMLSFKLGPVQPFIEAARTLRDLWSGSYLLSWLTAHGMKPIIDKYGYGAFITPHTSKENPLLRVVVEGEPTGDEAATLACLPHTFAAEVPADQAEGLKDAVVKAVEVEWKRIADAVKVALPLVMHSHFTNWDKQIETYFEITVVVRPNGATLPDSQAWADTEWKELAELLEMARSVRHVPAYSPTADNGRFPVKCSQLGSLEQMGPADFDKAKAYWAGLTRKGNDETPKKRWDGLHGTGLQSSDKLCAVALVKRFMWPAYFAETPDPRLTNRLGVHVHELRFTDTATMAARKWLADGELLDPDVVRNKSKEMHWSGQWLHWMTQEDDEDVPCSGWVWDIIQRKKADPKQGKPPTYFAQMHLDGDNMGGLFKGSRDQITGTTEKLTTFATGVQQIVKAHQGELIYAGGDDVLAFLPTETAIECARQLHEAFGKALPGATLSGGIAVVHYKEDLRFALGQVRAAEKAAKKISRAKLSPGESPKKDALALTICKRSGEHATVVMGWDETAKLQELVAEFKASASDRWAYKLRAELETLKALPLEAGRAEALRLVGRGENATDQFKSVIDSLFGAYQKQMQDPARDWLDADILTGFVGLCQTASFLARGKE